ncbi:MULTISPECIES: inorganic phosphate transporter [unclassified Clostridium]|uniref:inorganic phosphate transporter n=1 Tax=unclassified Clostridium TaxID=2614128 RepID=UPI00052CBA3A|nr:MULTISPECIES: inorganic phosphate transporter [unclassified Clostridium]KGK86756.1 inorganic phosphate transporter [Clostridium sp. HMP27]
MSTAYIIIGLTVVLALAFDFINGFHDTANAIATAVSTKALSPRRAIIMASLMNFIGAIAFTGVAKTIAKDIVNLDSIANGSVVILAALVSAIAWNLITWYFGIPSSSSHALIGSIAGAAIAAAGVSSINFKGFTSIIKSLLVSPILAFLVGYIVFTIFKNVFKNLNLSRTNIGFRRVQAITAAIQAFAHGTNDAQKSMGIITMALVSNNLIKSGDIPLWVQLACATAMALGTSVGGWRIIKTVGTQIMKIKPVNGVAADLSSALVIFGASKIGLPVSTTHVISSSIMGVGTSYRVRAVKWDTGKRMIITWFITLPISAALAAVIYMIMSMFL